MSGVPAGLEWLAPLIPLILPFILGFLIGVIVKKAIKVIAVIIILIVILSAAGYISYSLSDLFAKAAGILPQILGGVANIIPYTSLAFCAGLGIGLWKG